MKELFGIQVILNVNVINLVILVNIWIIQNVSVKKKLIDPLIEECTENDADETKLVNITAECTENDNETKIVNITVKNENSSCKVYIVLMTVVFTIFTGITIYFVYYNWSLIKNKVSCIKSNTHKKTII